MGSGGAIFGIFIFLALAGLIGVTLAYDVVDASHIGVKNRFGKIHGTMQPGLEYTGLFTHVEQYDLRVQKMTVEMLEGEKTSVDIDGQTVKSRIEINFRVNPKNIVQIYKEVGRQGDMVSILNIDGIVREGFKTTTSKYKSKEIWQKRNEVKREAIETISANFPNDYLLLENVIISDLDFNPEFIAAIEDQKTNEEKALAKEKEVEIASMEAKRVEATAKGQAEAQKVSADAQAYERKALAEADAYQKKQMADAQAFERLELGKAEAEALRLKKAELTENMVRNNWIDAWKSGGAQVPKWITSGDSGNFLFDVEVAE